MEVGLTWANRRSMLFSRAAAKDETYKPTDPLVDDHRCGSGMFVGRVPCGGYFLITEPLIHL